MDATLINAASRHLRKTDPVMSQLIKHNGQPVFTRKRLPHYHSLVRAIINQQLSVKAGHTIEKRLLERQGGRFFKAEAILTLEPAVIRSCGLSNNKVRYIHTLAQAVACGELNFRKLAKRDDDSVRDALILYPGIGQWSADMFLITSLRRPDVFPVGDLVLRKSMQHHYQLADGFPHADYVSIAENWRPYRTIASYYLWNASH